jgi:hypothetical protein
MIRGTFRQRSASCLSFPRVREMLNRTTEGYCARDYRTAFANAQGSASVRDTAVFICSRSKGTRSCGSEMSIRNFLNQRAVEVVVSGNYVLPNCYDQYGNPRTFACRTSTCRRSV